MAAARSPMPRPARPPVPRGSAGITKRFGALVGQRRDRLRAAARRGRGAARRERRRQDHADEHPVRPLRGRRGRSIEVVRHGRCRRATPHAALAAGIGMVHQHFTLADNLTVLDNIVLGTEPLWRWRLDTRRRARNGSTGSRTISGSRSTPTRRVGELSVGERQRVEILKALYRDARILILDEPTAVLTPQETEALFAHAEAAGRARACRSSSSPTSSTRCWRSADRIARAARGPAGRASARRRRPTAPSSPQLMVGREVSAEPRSSRSAPGPALLRLERRRPSGPARPRRRSTASTSTCTAARSSASPASPATARAALADLVCRHCMQPAPATVTLFGEARPRPGRRARRSTRGVGRIPEDRHARRADRRHVA